MKKIVPYSIVSLVLLLSSCGSPKNKSAEPPSSSPGHEVAGAQKAKSDSGVVTTASGLSYKVLVRGPAGGVSPTINDTVVVHYRGTLVDGSEFDSSYSRGQPATFGVSQVIPGWTQALQLMKPGDKWLIKIPFNLAYGSRGSPPKIPPFADLTFQVELLNVLR